MISFMETVTREATLLRLRPQVMARVKYYAKREKKSMNSFIEDVLEQATLAKIPKLPKDFKIDPVISSFNGIMRAPSQEELEADPRLAHIMAL